MAGGRWSPREVSPAARGPSPARVMIGATAAIRCLVLSCLALSSLGDEPPESWSKNHFIATEGLVKRNPWGYI